MRKPDVSIPFCALRYHLRVSQTRLAWMLQSQPSHISQVEQGRKGIGARFALKVLDRFRAEMDSAGITLEDLLRGTFDHPGGDAG